MREREKCEHRRRERSQSYPMKTYYNVVVLDRNNLNLWLVIDISEFYTVVCDRQEEDTEDSSILIDIS